MRGRIALVLALLGSQLLAGSPASAAENSFDDDDTSIFEPDIEALAAEGITRGCGDREFCPIDSASRGQMAAFLVRALDLPPDDTDRFTDDDGSIFEADIQALAASGITRGCGDREFCPQLRVSREQMAALLVRALDLPPDDQDRFSDDDDSMFEQEIQALAAAGITAGCGNDRFCPENDVTREQMAAFLVRALDLPRGEDPTPDDDSSS